MLGTSDAWLVVRLDKRTSEGAYYIIDWRTYTEDCHFGLGQFIFGLKFLPQTFAFALWLS